MIQDQLNHLAAGQNLSRPEAAHLLELIISDKLSATEIGALLMGLRTKGESAAEISGFLDTMQRHMIKVELNDKEAIDVCGTGGDGTHSFNVSTTAALVTAAGGVTVAKHGNRSVSSKSGSADLLEALGVHINLLPEQAKQCADQIGLCFFFAPHYHPAMKQVVPHRKSLGIRTVFNLLGPLLNPALVKRQLIGVFNAASAKKMAAVLADRSYQKACTVHSLDGFDELSPYAANQVYEVTAARPTPRSYQLEYPGGRILAENMVGGADSSANADITRGILQGGNGPARAMTVFNAGMAFYVSGKVADISDGVQVAEEMIDSGAALKKLQQFVEISNDLAGSN